MELDAYHQLCRRFIGEHLRPPPGPTLYPDCPELEGTSLAQLLASFRPRSPILSAHNRILGRNRLGLEDGHLIFCEENQAVSYWGVRVEDLPAPNPPVWRAANQDPLEWEREFETLAAFLSTFVLWQLVNGAWPYSAYADRVTPGAGRALETLLEPIPIPGSSTGFNWLARSDDLVAARVAEEVFVGARTQSAWEALEAAVPIDWSYASVEDQPESSGAR